MESGIEILLEKGLCTDPEIDSLIFFPSDGAGVERARKICVECPAKDACLDYAIESRNNHGVWGGTSERQRRRTISAMNEAKAAIKEDQPGNVLNKP